MNKQGGLMNAELAKALRCKECFDLCNVESCRYHITNTKSGCKCAIKLMAADAADALEAADKRVKELETIVTNAEKCDFENRTDCDYCENIQRAVIRIAEREAAQRWIPVSERLPAVSEYRNGDKFKSMDSNELVPFLVCCEDTEIPFRAFYDGKNWGDGWGKQNVTHWQHLPQPPEKGE